MTDNEIVKALESWLEEIRKARQAYLEKVNEEHYPSMRYEYLLSDTIHEINRLQAKIVVEQNYDDCLNTEIDRLKQNLEEAHIDIREHLAENEKLKYCNETNISSIATLHEQLKNAKAEAYKEFAKRLIAVSHPYADTQVVFELQIDNLLKELVEG